MDHGHYVLITHPNLLAEKFAGALRERNIPYAVLVNSGRKRKEIEWLSIPRFVELDTNKPGQLQIPDIPVGAVYIFEESLPLTCRYLQVIRHWTSKPIVVITSMVNPRSIYRVLGASHVLFTCSDDVSFLLDNQSNPYEKDDGICSI
ncbi:hypothetical protein DNH61_06165 [Paenibacillus sambharensis]|uniref:Uncharacterized protein n=1 Tax=Paenibacillus sambharensis TaxID=1803190 RepID=A0A2W1L9A9_9BACL|nr:hypothetical protein [Paenibacillus sambharensis]PZD96778.1 hypothetical protein DNH61_06165 [Paenibacillus sambharensis]